MQGNQTVIQALNGALKVQLTAINQFFLHARMCRNWGLGQLDSHSYKRSITAMKLADDLIERLLFLGGLPNLQDLGKLLLGEDVPEMLRNDLAFQQQAHHQIQALIASCETQQDYVSRELGEKLLDATEQHIDWLESQLWLIDQTGLENYLQSAI